ncbi:FHA domain-containing protein [Clostridium sp.]|uniref:FHA domain-containing protein n=1 Tax=Clostridium sp. TaxID=1506 RepID=UPI003463E8B6
MDTNGFQRLILFNIKDKVTIKIPPLGGIIGRSGDIEPSYFEKNSYISRKHAKLTYMRGGYLIEDLGSSNGTKVNGLKLYKNTSVHIKGGDTITLADIEFEVKYHFKY